MKENYLVNWEIGKSPCGNVVVIGIIYNDTKKRFEDGTKINTSKVLKADFEKGIIKTRNSVYSLEI